MIKRLIFSVIALLGLVSCFDETSYDTTYVLQVYEQEESSGDYIPLAMTKAYAFAGTTDEWEFESYDHAEVGIITSTLTGEQKGPFAVSQSYNGSESDIFLQLDRAEVVIVIIDPASKVYAYTDYSVPINYPEMLVDIVFRSWKDVSYTASTWTFIVPTVEEEEDENPDDNSVIE